MASEEEKKKKKKKKKEKKHKKHKSNGTESEVRHMIAYAMCMLCMLDTNVL